MPFTGDKVRNPDEQQIEGFYFAWQESLRGLTADASTLALWQERRYRFAHRVRRALLGASFAGSASVVGPVIYGIYTVAGLCYIGQTHEAERRLGDLPVGESHHVGNTLPPELWDRVVVLRWPALLPTIPTKERATIEEIGYEVCGLALEYALQVKTGPLLNIRRRDRNGEWRARDLGKSRSRGAVHAARLPGLCQIVLATWHELEAVQIPDEEFVWDTQSGRIVLPARISRAAR
ncbi:hypothetical protein G9272_25285 [Streptomyces asoensis]|uniref:Uncharacterized protein n=1 Tax=Streptomyces asoensis TaxID=249586 RepID=A0A6M4XG77_9ACTN|nr:hypothetical protein G9272_25285 [Streptomyces asoensis]